PFNPLLVFHNVTRPNPANGEKGFVMVGMCHHCRKWVPIKGVKIVQIKIPELIWWKEVAVLHGVRTIESENGMFKGDEVM
ncbi:hypothetical protein EV421DRAFT_1682757, partial [Armillaria borealis]